MKRVLWIALVMLLVCAVSLAESGTPDSWAQTTAQGLMDTLGLQLGLPDGATNVNWQMLEAEQLGEVQFTWQAVDCCARVAPTDDFEDISGLHRDWQARESCTVGRCEGICLRAEGEAGATELCLWFDDRTGLMYALCAVADELDGFDMLAAANILYIPMQTE